MNQSVYERMKSDSKQKKTGFEIKQIKQKGVSIFVYLNPTCDEEPIQKIHE